MSINNYYTITSALPYANGPIHIGHLAGVYIPSDIYVRYLRSKRKKVIFIGGSDEHGISIKTIAKKEKKSPEEIINKYHNINNKSLKNFGISFDIFSRTSSKIHKKTSRKFFKELHKKDIFEIYKNKNSYDVIYNQFLPDKYLFNMRKKCFSWSKLSNKKSILKKTKH